MDGWMGKTFLDLRNSTALAGASEANRIATLAAGSGIRRLLAFIQLWMAANSSYCALQVARVSGDDGTTRGFEWVGLLLASFGPTLLSTLFYTSLPPHVTLARHDASLSLSRSPVSFLSSLRLWPLA